MVVVGSPYLGADPVGAVALTAGVSVAAAISTGGWLTFSRLAWATMAGAGGRPSASPCSTCAARPDERGSLGRFLDRPRRGHRRADRAPVQRGELRGAGQQPADRAGRWSAAVLVWFALLQPWGGLKRLFGIYPAIRAAMAGTAVAAVLGGVLGGAALDVAGAAAALVVPMAALAALRVLDHAADRTAGAGVGVRRRTSRPTRCPARCSPPSADPWRTAATPARTAHADAARRPPTAGEVTVRRGRRRAPLRRGAVTVVPAGAPGPGRCYRGIPWIA